MTSATERDNDSVYDEYQVHEYDDYINHNGSNACIRTLLKNKWLILLLVMLPSLGGLIVGLSLHYTNSSTTTPTPTLLVLSTRIPRASISGNMPMSLTVDFLGKEE